MFVDFVNSDWYDGSGHSKDRLLVPGWLAAFAAKWLSGRPVSDTADSDLFGPHSLESVPTPRRTALRSEDLTYLDGLRTALRQFVDAAEAGEGVPAKVVGRLNRYLDAGPIRYHLATDGESQSLHAVADGRDVQAVAAAVALSAAEFAARGDLSRLKQCDNHGCRWVFYDTTKNAGRRWCDSRLCGNVDKVRRYRERHHAAR